MMTVVKPARSSLFPPVDHDARILSTHEPFNGFRLANGQSLLSNKEGITVAFENWAQTLA